MPKQTVKRKKRILRHAPSPQHKKLMRIKKRSRAKRPVAQEEPVGTVKAAELAPSSEDVEADVVEVMEVRMMCSPEGQEELDEAETAADLLLLDED